MTPKIGIMQGRLSPPQDGLFQFSPQNWQAEFPLAKRLGFDSIEWIYDAGGWCPSHWDGALDPILKQKCREEIRKLSSTHNVGVNSICADYFMNGGFRRSSDDQVSILNILIFIAMSLKIKIIVLPFLEKSTLNDRKQKTKATEMISKVLEACDYCGVKLALETELDGKNLKRFIKKFNSPHVGVCYDLGNTASYGHDSPRDINMLGNLIFEVHIKDRKIGSAKSVNLGAGDVNFKGCFRALKNIGFNGPMILQANRSDVSYLDDAQRQLDFVRTKWGRQNR